MKWHRIAVGARRDAIVLARSPCGALYLELSGVTAALRRSGALWLPEASVLAAGDLHLEKGSSFAARGQLLPPYDTRATLHALLAEIEALRPRTVVLLGDSFHDERALGRLAADDIARIADISRRSELVWVAGNHDASLRSGSIGLPGRVVEAHDVQGLVLRHEPAFGRQTGEVAGHLHPCAKVSGRAGGIRRRAFLTDGERLILPAFGAYAGGLNALDPAFMSLFAGEPLAGVMGTDAVHPIAFSALRPD
jgi:DNA ligase-associated metallophosphoesterase